MSPPVLRDVPRALWDDVVRRCEYSTFFHTFPWIDAMARLEPFGRVGTLGFHLGQDDWAILPMVECEPEAGGFFRSLCSSPPGVYGGLIATVPPTPAQMHGIRHELQSIRAKQIDIFGNPYAPTSIPSDGWERQETFTQVIPLDEFSTEEELLRSYAHCIRNGTRKARKTGYTCKRAETLEELRAYYELYRRSVERWGARATSDYKFPLFKTLFTDLGAGAPLWLALREGRIVGGVLSLPHKRHWVVWHSAFDETEFKAGVAKFLHHEIIWRAKAGGFRFYDFNPSGGHEGTVRFKEMFGARKVFFSRDRWDQNAFYRAWSRAKTVPLELERGLGRFAAGFL